MDTLRETIKIPEEVNVSIEKGRIIVKGTKGTLERDLSFPGIEITRRGETIEISTKNPKKSQRAILGTVSAHIKNMIKGVSEGFTYRLKIAYAHFPITVKVSKDKVIIENFIGEKYPRTAKIVGDTKVEISGEDITVSGINKEEVGQTAANIEQATKVKRRDLRVFQDGIYIVEKDGKSIV
ncbi:MAG: 50S ribosomal protein L6 [Candidatus Hydrothermarchaeota archaeon]